MSLRTPKAARRAVPVAASLAALGAIAALPAIGDARPSHIPGAGQGAQLTTSAPDLRSAAISGTAVRYCFDQPIVAVNAADFYVLTYDSTRYQQATSAQVDVDNANCAFVRFAAGADLAQGTVAQIGNGAVSDSARRAATAASEPLGGSAARPVAGATTGPDLTSVNGANGNDNTLNFNFDEALAGGTPTPGNFIITNQSGANVAGVAATINGSTVTVRFPAGTAGAVGGAARAAVLAGAVTDRGQTGSFIAGRAATTPNGTDAKALGPIGNPTIVSAAASSSKEFNVKYDQRVDAGTPAAYQAVLDDGTTVAANSVIASATDASVIVVTFPDSVGGEAPVRIVDVGGGARVGTASSAVTAVSTGTANNSPGFTNAPDLVQVTRDDSTNRVSYRFDEGVSSSVAGSFFGVASTGARIPSAGPASNNGTSTLVVFSAANRASQGAGVQEGAAVDSLGHPSPFSSISYVTEQAPGTPSTPTPTPTPTTPTTTPTTTTPTTKPRAATRVTLRRTSKRLTGSVKSSGRGCQVGRKVYLKRVGKSKSLKSTSTNSKGVYRFSRTKSTRGKKVRVYVGARTGTYAICGGKTSKTIRG